MKDSLDALHQDWRERKQAIAELASAEGGKRAVTADRLVELIQAESLDLGVLNAALQTLIALGPAALPRLQPLLTDASPEVRQAAAVVLGQLEAPLGVPTLLEMLRDSDSNVRYHAVEALGQQQALAAIPPLLELAVGGDDFLAFAALEALANIGDPAALPELISLLDHPMLAGSAAEALGRIGHPLAYRPLLAALEGIEEAGPALESLVRRNPGLQVKLTPAQRAIMSQHFWTLEREGEVPPEELFAPATEALPIIAAGAQQRTLHWACGHENAELRLAAAEKLSPPPVQVVIDLLPEFPARAARVLAACGATRALPDLVLQLNHPSLLVRHTLVEEGLRLGLPRPELESLLSSAQAGERGAAARWLVAGGALAGEQLKDWLAGENEERVRCEVLEALPVNAANLKLVEQRLREGSAAEAILLTRRLAEWPEKDGLPLLKRRADLWCCVYLCRTLQRWRARPDWLEEMLDDLRPPVRAEAAKALARVEPDLAARRLPLLLLDAELDVAEAALLALAQIECWEPVRQAVQEARLQATAQKALALSQHSEDLAELPVAALLESGNPAAFQSLLVRLEQLGRSQVAALREAISRAGWRPVDLPRGRLIPQVLDRVDELFDDTDPWVRRGALLQNFEMLAERARRDPDEKIRGFVEGASS